MNNFSLLFNSSINLNQIKNFFEDFDDEICLMDCSGKILYINHTCEKLYKLSQKQMIDKNADEFVRRGYWYPALYRNFANNNQIISTNQEHKSGIKYPVRGYPISQDNQIKFSFWHKLIGQESSDFNYLPQHIFQNNPFITQTEITSKSLVMGKCISMAQKLSTVDVNVLIQGESGTGKSSIAKYIHHLSKRKNNSFTILNCASIPDTLVEAELFGYTDGSFTGAVKGGKRGIIDETNGGTLFLDEIGEIPIHLQAKLLQFLQDGTFIPVGSTKQKYADVRILSATNQDLKKAIIEGKFREDLYYRINVVDLELPPLRKRKEDIPDITQNILNKFNNKYGRNCKIEGQTMENLLKYPWPGNIRELSNFIEKEVILNDNEIISIDALQQDNKLAINAQEQEHWSQSFFEPDLPLTLKERSEMLILECYKREKSSRKVANLLGISQTKVSKVVREQLESSKSDI